MYVQRHGTDPTAPDPRAEIRKQIVRRLSTDEWMNRHFGIACHAGDVADAVLELFKLIKIERFFEWDGPDYPTGFEPVTHTRLALRTAMEPTP